jgi:EAL domain-containing protein (putative c-di-GMP-specific phosphodiesterase class I)
MEAVMQVDQPLAEALDSILARRAIECVFQPIVALRSEKVIGFEALARGPAGTVLSDPDALFAFAGKAGRLPELDWVCRAAAARAALASKLPPDLPLFINVEPATARVLCPSDLIEVLATATDRLQIVAEITERSVASDPAGLLAAIEQLRTHHNRIALDDVGVDDSSQAMMSLMRPDVIKLDRRIVQGRTTPLVAAVVTAVLAEAERTGAIILAEGIETPAQAALARSMGATLGQGWLFGHPGPLPSRFIPSGFVLPQIVAPPPDGATPFEVARKRRRVTYGNKQMLLALSKHLEDRVVAATEPAVVLATFQNVAYFDAPTRTRYGNLAAKGILTATFGLGMPVEPGPQIRGCAVAEDDPLVHQWNVIVLGSHFAGALFARELPYDGDEDDRPFELIVSYDRDLILAAAHPLIRRLLPIN